MILPAACPGPRRNRPARALLVAGIAVLAALASACGGAGQRSVNGAATATAAASATAAAIPVVVGVTAAQTQPIAGGHPHIAATVDHPQPDRAARLRGRKHL